MWFRSRRSMPAATFTADGHVGGSVVDVTDGNFLASTVGQYTVVDFWAPWCQPCRAFSPIFHDVAAHAVDGVRFATCNVDDNPNTAALLQISTIPTVVVFGPDGSEVARSSGVVSCPRLEKLIAGATAKAANRVAG